MRRLRQSIIKLLVRMMVNVDKSLIVIVMNKVPQPGSYLTIERETECVHAVFVAGKAKQPGYRAHTSTPVGK